MLALQHRPFRCPCLLGADACGSLSRSSAWLAVSSLVSRTGLDRAAAARGSIRPVCLHAGRQKSGLQHGVLGAAPRRQPLAGTVSSHGLLRLAPSRPLALGLLLATTPASQPQPAKHWRGCRQAADGKWQARIRRDGGEVHLGRYASGEEAARAYDRAAVRLRPHTGIELNFPLSDYVDATGALLPHPHTDELLSGKRVAATAAGKAKRSRFIGVTQERGVSTYRAQIGTGGSEHNTTLTLGSYRKEEDAARAYDKAALRLRPWGKEGALNFPRSDYFDNAGQLLPDPHIDELLSKPRGGAKARPAMPPLAPKSGFYGVSVDGAKWRVRIRREGAYLSFGRYDTPELAARAHDEAIVRMRPRGEQVLNYPYEDYVDAQGQLLPALDMEARLRGFGIDWEQ